MSWRRASAARAALLADGAAAERRHLAVRQAGEAPQISDGQRVLERVVAAGEARLLAGGNAAVSQRSAIAGGRVGGAESLGFPAIHPLQRVGFHMV